MTIAGGMAPAADEGEIFLNQFGDATVAAAIDSLGETDAWRVFFDGNGTATYTGLGWAAAEPRVDLEMGLWDDLVSVRDWYVDNSINVRDPQVVHTAFTAAINTVQLGEHGDDDTGAYTLTINGPSAGVVNLLFVEPFPFLGTHTIVLNGELLDPGRTIGDTDFYGFTAPAQGRYRITVTPTGGVGTIDATWNLFDAAGNPLIGDHVTAIDNLGDGGAEQASVFLRRGQSVALRVGDDLGDTAGNYRVDVKGYRSNVAIFRDGLTIQDSDGDYRYGATDTHFAFGVAGDVPIAGNFTGTGSDLAGVYRGGLWLIDLNDSKAWDGGDVGFSFGLASDHPVVGDLNGDGRDEVGVFRDGLWLIDANNTGVWDGGDIGFAFGETGDWPVMQDWNGDGRDDPGVFRNGLFLLDADGSRGWGPGDVGFVFGTTGDRPIAGDWNGNGFGKVGVYRAGQFILDRNGTRAYDAGDVGIHYGQPGDLPVIGQWWEGGALTAAALPEVGHDAGAGVTAEHLAPLVEQAILLWQASGLDASAAALLRGTEFRIGDLPGAELARHLGGAVILDVNAAGWGWFVDPTPAANEEFPASTAEGLLAESTPAAGRMDLLTVLAHELGHTLDMADQDAGVMVGQVMAASLPAGVRRLPD